MSQDRIEQHFEVLNAISDLTFFPKKTSIAECLLEFDKHLKQRLKLDYRQEAYAVKSMFLWWAIPIYTTFAICHL